MCWLSVGVDCKLWLPLPEFWEGLVICITRPGKDQNEKFKVQFLLNVHCFHIIITLKNHKLNYHKSQTGSVCIIQILIPSILWGKPVKSFNRNMSELKSFLINTHIRVCLLNALGKEMAIQSSILSWEIPWTEEPGGLLSLGVTKICTRLSNWTITTTRWHALFKVLISINVSNPHAAYRIGTITMPFLLASTETKELS